MRMIVFFDLPTLTKTDRRNASRLRNFLLKDGYSPHIYYEFLPKCPFESNKRFDIRGSLRCIFRANAAKFSYGK